jgi:hypothetical protein
MLDFDIRHAEQIKKGLLSLKKGILKKHGRYLYNKKRSAKIFCSR